MVIHFLALKDKSYNDSQEKHLDPKRMEDQSPSLDCIKAFLFFVICIYLFQYGPSKLPSLNTNNSKNQHDGIISKNEGMMAGLALFPPHTRAPRERRGSMEQAIGRCRPTADPR
jgi:hypothetical protein